MDISDTPDEAAFRAEANTWLTEHATPRSQGSDEPGLVDHVQRARDWQRKLHDHGWAGLSWPEEFGGRGLAGTYATIFAEEMAGF